MKDGSGEQKERQFFPEEGKIRVGGNQRGALKVGQGRGKAVGVWELVLRFEFGGKARLFEVSRYDAYWQLGDLFDNVLGHTGAAGAPDGVVDFTPINNAHVALYGHGEIWQSEKVARASSLSTFLVMFYEFAFVVGEGVV
jgi:hypothetical protein